MRVCFDLFRTHMRIAAVRFTVRPAEPVHTSSILLLPFLSSGCTAIWGYKLCCTGNRGPLMVDGDFMPVFPL